LLTGEGERGGRGAESYDRKKGWPSINHSLLFGLVAGRDWADDRQGQGEEFLYHATQVKNIWLTMGDIFAN
jgi:hypothetical protein